MAKSSLHSVASGDNYKFTFTAKVSSQNGSSPAVTWQGAKDATMSQDDDKSMLVELKEPLMDEDLMIKASYDTSDVPYIVMEPGQKGIVIIKSNGLS